MIRNTNVDSGSVSQHFSNAAVSGCSNSLYEAMSDFAKMLVYKERSGMYYLDLVHDVLLMENVDESNYKNKIRSVFYHEREAHSIISQFNDWKPKKEGIELYPCKYCSQSLPVDAFRKRFREDGVPYYSFKSCLQCEYKADKTLLERCRRYWHKQKLAISDVYVIRLFKRYKEMPIEDITNDDIEIKRTEVLLSRISKAIKYKDYARQRTKTYTKPKVSRKKAK